MKNLLIVLLCIPLLFSAQDKKEKDTIPPSFRISGVYLGGGLSTLKQEALTNEELLVVRPDLVNKPYLGYNQHLYPWGGRILNIMITGGISVGRYKKRKEMYGTQEQFFVGLAYARESKLHTGFENKRYTRKDTLNSTGNYLSYYRDSMDIRNYWLDYHSNNLGLDVQHTFSTAADKFISLYTGYGFSLNYSVKSVITERYNHDTGTRLYHDSAMVMGQIASPLESFYSYHEEAKLKAKRSFTAKIYLPVGASIRLSKCDDFFRNVFFTLQGRFGYDSVKIGSVAPKTVFTISGLAGFKYCF